MGQRQLVLVREAKIASLLAGAEDRRLEASGVLATGGCFFVVFDNAPDIGRLGVELRRGAADDFPVDGPNKGLEGLTCVRRAGRAYLLGLCEGNRCKDGPEGRRPGGGRIQVFDRGGRDWDHAGTIRLPASLWFEDYSSLAVVGDRVAVMSQSSSALWVGRLRPSGWELADEGRVWAFPPDREGRTIYCSIEGVSWVAADRVVVVSDRAKREGQDQRCRAKDQSIHVFAIPDLG
jgi:hypothetical protein